MFFNKIILKINKYNENYSKGVFYGKNFLNKFNEKYSKLLFLRFNLTQLLFFNLHVGSSINKVSKESQWFFKYISNEVIIINLYKLYKYLYGTLSAYYVAGVNNRVCWFASKDPFFKEILIHFANSSLNVSICGFWSPGLITNYRQFIVDHKEFRILNNSFLTSSVMNTKIKKFLSLFYVPRVSLPFIIFFSDTDSNFLPLRECVQNKVLSAVPMDTDAHTSDIYLPLPSNSKSILTVFFF